MAPAIDRQHPHLVPRTEGHPWRAQAAGRTSRPSSRTRGSTSPRRARWCRDRDLSIEEKRKILDSWALDAQLLSVAEEENMGGQDRPGLREVKLALLELEKGA